MSQETRCPNCGAVLSIADNQATVVPGVAIEAPNNVVTSDTVPAEVQAPVDADAPVVDVAVPAVDATDTTPNAA